MWISVAEFHARLFNFMPVYEMMCPPYVKRKTLLEAFYGNELKLMKGTRVIESFTVSCVNTADGNVFVAELFHLTG